MALFGVSLGRSSAASCSQSFSGSGSFSGSVKVLLQDQLGGDRIYRLLLDAAQPTLRFDGRETLVDARDRQVIAAFQLAGEALYAPRERMFAVRCHRQPDHQLRRAPFGDEL